MKTFLQIISIAFFMIACNQDDEVSPPPENGIPVIQSSSIFDVIVESDVVYAEGLSHQNLNSANSSTMQLTLDVYQPNNDIENRPAFMFIHGGGFLGGDKKQSNIVSIANYFASRGWVFYSINYRVLGDKGSVPQDWATYASSLDEELTPQFLAIYPAHRDAKAALRWVVTNAETYNINTDYITVGGGSAGAITAISLGISNPEDFRDEISASIDPTLSSTNLDQTYQVQTIIDFWGSKVALDALDSVYGHNRFDSNDPPMLIVHGTADPTVPFSGAEDLKAIYESYNIPLAYYPLEGVGHGAWSATVDGKAIEELSFDFIVEQQKLTVE